LISKRLKNAGHHPILLVGGGTGLIGDPRPSSERPMITKEEVEHNFCCLKEQAEKQASQEEIIQKYRSITQLTRPIICELIDQIQVGKKDPETKQIPIKIIWNI